LSEPRGSRLYGRAIGKTLRKEPRRLIAEALPTLAIPTEGALSPASLFAAEMADVWLEIGFGGGEHLVGMAAAHPDVGFLGCEPFVNGVAKALAGVETSALANVRIHAGDAMQLVARLPEASIGRLFVLFPDPWPKRRHNKRRVISDESLAAFARVLRPSGALLFASDIDDYVGWTLARVLRSDGFVWKPADWLTPWPGSPATKYRQKAIREGRRPVYLTFERRAGA
jgi:tRNA (guanine-N7-)-methyltransferase